MMPGSFVANPSRYGKLSTLSPRFRRPSDSDTISPEGSAGNQSPRWGKGSKERPNEDKDKDKEPSVIDDTDLDVSIVRESSEIGNGLFYLEGQSDNSPFYNLFFYKKRKYLPLSSFYGKPINPTLAHVIALGWDKTIGPLIVLHPQKYFLNPVLIHFGF